MKYSIATITLLSASVLAYVPNPYYKRNIGADVATPCDKDNAVPTETPYLPPPADLAIDNSEPLDIPAEDNSLDSEEPQYDSEVQMAPEGEATPCVIDLEQEIPDYTDTEVKPADEEIPYVPAEDIAVESEETPCGASDEVSAHEIEVAPVATPTLDEIDYATSTEIPELEPAYNSIPEELPTDSEIPESYDDIPEEMPTDSEIPESFDDIPEAEEMPTDSEIPASYDDIPLETPTYSEEPASYDDIPLETPTYSEEPASHDSDTIPEEMQPSSVYNTMPIESPTYSQEPVVYETSLPVDTPSESEAPLLEGSPEAIPEYDSSIPMSGSRTNTASIVLGLVMLSFFS